VKGADLVTYVLRHLWVRKVRSALCVLGVAVSVGMLVAILSLTYGLRSSFNTYMEDSGASLVVFAREAADLAFSRVDAAAADRIGALDGVSDVARANFTFIMSPRLGPKSQRSAGIVFVFGRFFEERMIQKYQAWLESGRLPREPSEVLVGSFAARQMDISVGDRFPLFHKELRGIREYEVVGVFQSPIGWENLGVVVHAGVVQEQLAAGDKFSLLFVYTAPSGAQEVRRRIEAEFPELVAMPSGEFTERFSEQLRYVDEFVVILTVICGVVGMLGILNTLMMSISERVREIGTLRAVGWSRRRVLATIVSEGLVLSLAGGLLGLGGGVAGTEVLLQWMPSGLLVATYEPLTFAIAFSLALVVGVAGAFYPALRASSLKPAEALRYE
jgi:putative ABC transport system permease protein